jgi:predicted transcriptional regulator
MKETVRSRSSPLGDGLTRKCCSREDMLRAWEEFQQTGLRLTHEEVDAWMAKLEAGEDAKLPACHR